jgi:hypothetical protein
MLQRARGRCACGSLLRIVTLVAASGLRISSPLQPNIAYGLHETNVKADVHIFLGVIDVLGGSCQQGRHFTGFGK